MILRLALRELWHAKTALLLQVASLTVAIAALSASAQLSAQTQGGPTPGAGCGHEVLELTGLDDSDSPKPGWTPRQTQALLQNMGSTLAAGVTGTVANVRTANGLEQVSADFVGPNYFELLCVERHDALGARVTGPFTKGAVLDAILLPTLTGLRQVRADASALDVEASTSGFLGLQYKADPVKAWLPMAVAMARGEEFVGSDIAVMHILLRPRPPETKQDIQARLEAVLRAQPTLFKGITRVQFTPSLQIDAWTADKIALVTVVLRLFAGALLLLATVNLMTYHAGRMPVAQTLATTLAALGVPPSALWAYACIEPVAVGLPSLLLGIALSLPLGDLALISATNDPSVVLQGSWQTSVVAFLVIGFITAAIVVIRGRMMTRRESPSKSRAQRALLRWLPLLLTLQMALAGVTLTLAAQAMAGLFQALPPLPNFPLTGLSVIQIDLGKNQPPQEHIQLRWASSWGTRHPAGYDAALATQIAPFLPNIGMMTALVNSRRSTHGYDQFVTANFFDVLGARIPGAHALAQDSDPRQLSQSSGQIPHIVLNSRAAMEVLGDSPSVGTVLRYNHDMDGHPDALSASAVVIGVFDDGIVGAQGAKGEVNISQLSMQAAIPMVYQSLDSMGQRDGRSLYVFVRHPPGDVDSQIMATVMPTVKSLFPGAEVLEIDSSMTLYRHPLLKERAIALVLGLLAASSLAIGLLGMLSLMTMLLRSLKVELAVRYAVGATRRQAAQQMAKRLVVPAATGLAFGAVPAGAGVYFLGQALETAARAGLWGPLIGLVAMTIACATVVLHSRRTILSANFMDWLRYE